jgi:hypothetical protein
MGLGTQYSGKEDTVRAGLKLLIVNTGLRADLRTAEHYKTASSGRHAVVGEKAVDVLRQRYTAKNLLPLPAQSVRDESVQGLLLEWTVHLESTLLVLLVAKRRVAAEGLLTTPAGAASAAQEFVGCSDFERPAGSSSVYAAWVMHGPVDFASPLGSCRQGECQVGDRDCGPFDVEGSCEEGYRAVFPSPGCVASSDTQDSTLEEAYSEGFESFELVFWAFGGALQRPGELQPGRGGESAVGCGIGEGTSLVRSQPLCQTFQANTLPEGLV